jgi:hypothetical protein
MNHALVFRSIVFTSALLEVASYLLPYGSFESDSAALNLLRLDGYAAIATFNNPLPTIGVRVLWLIASIGLLHFDNWARYLYVVLTAWALLAAALYGIRVTAPLEAVFDLAVTLLDGMIIALAFLSPLKERFSRSNPRP